jgi:hypothetical protein
MKKALVLLFLSFAHQLYGQLVLENNPTGISWYQVNTPHFRVLFPEGFDGQAQRVANTLEYIHDAEAKSLGTSPRKISIILQNQSSVSNGFVSLLPRRSEFYTMPSQNYNFLGTNDWLDLLASHEYRHIVQYQHATRGFNRVFYYLFGNPTLAGMSQAAAPQWFWEGDAVATETAFTSSGRGRIPNFGLLFRTNLLEGRTFNYHKQYLRSYKHNIPDHYVLGYHMISYLRRKTNDPEIWGKITARSWSVPFIPFAFSNAIKNKTGLYVTDLYNEMASNLKKEWQAEVDQLQITSFERVNPRTTKAYTDYLYPQALEDGSVLAMKRGIGDIEQFVILKDGKEKKIFTPGFMNDAGMLSVVNNTVVWNEYGYDPRWQVRNYSLIKAFDLGIRKLVVVSDKHARYGSAALSPDGKKIVTVRSDNQYQHRLLVLQYPGGSIEKEFPNPENFFYAMPRWTGDGRIVALKTTGQGKTITIFDIQSGSSEDILPVSNENVGHPLAVSNYLLFNSPVSGIDNIYAVDIQTGKRYQVTSSKYGAYNPSITADGKTIYYNEQVRDGMDVVRIPFNPASWKEYEVKKEPKTFFQHLVEQEGRPNIFDSIPQTKLAVTKYSKLRGLINPFSWGAFVDNNLVQADFGITSRDILSTTNITAGYTLDLSERTGFWRAGISYQGFFPIIDVNFRQGKRSVDEDRLPTLIIDGNDSTVVTNDITFKWDEQNLEAGLRIPLITTQSRFSSGITVGNAVGMTKVTNFRYSFINSDNFINERYVPAIIRNDTILSVYPYFDYIGNGTLVYNHFTMSAHRLLKTSRRDILPKWGQAFSLNYYSAPYGGDLQGGLFSFIGYLYFPGLAKHHSLNGYWAYQNTLVDTDFIGALDDYLFRNSVPLPRGLDLNRFKKFYSMGANYTFPVWYPDIALGPILNIQRVRANAFVDYAFGQYRLFNGGNDSFMSVGGEIKFDINIMRFLPQLNLGLRYSQGIDPKESKYKFLLGTFNF